jgi:hypothetical protein
MSPVSERGVGYEETYLVLRDDHKSSWAISNPSHSKASNPRKWLDTFAMRVATRSSSTSSSGLVHSIEFTRTIRRLICCVISGRLARLMSAVLQCLFVFSSTVEYSTGARSVLSRRDCSPLATPGWGVSVVAIMAYQNSRRLQAAEHLANTTDAQLPG